MRIECRTGTDAEQAVAQELTVLLGELDLAPWAVTDLVMVEEGATPHSHPTLTLGTFNRGPFLLASYIHEQIHWHLTAQFDRLERVLETELMTRFPEVPVGFPEGAHDAESTYLHLFVCWYEVEALRHVLGEARASEVLDVLIEHGVYRWVYRTVRERFDELGALYADRGLRSALAR